MLNIYYMKTNKKKISCRTLQFSISHNKTCSDYKLFKMIYVRNVNKLLTPDSLFIFIMKMPKGKTRSRWCLAFRQTSNGKETQNGAKNPGGVCVVNSFLCMLSAQILKTGWIVIVTQKDILTLGILTGWTNALKNTPNITPNAFKW